MPDYLIYIIISSAVLVLITIGLVVALMIKVQYITRYFNNRKFKISMKLEVDPMTHVDKFVFRVFNNNLNDARVSDLGIGYDQESITFYKDKFEKDELEEGAWLVIQTRDSISIDIDVKHTYELILERNKGIYRLKKVRVYVVDAAGFETRVKARDFVKTIKKMLKADRKLIALAKRKIRHEKIKAFFDFKKNLEEAKLAREKKKAEASAKLVVEPEITEVFETSHVEKEPKILADEKTSDKELENEIEGLEEDLNMDGTPVTVKLEEDLLEEPVLEPEEVDEIKVDKLEERHD